MKGLTSITDHAESPMARLDRLAVLTVNKEEAKVKRQRAKKRAKAKQ